MKIYDLTLPITPDLIVWPGDPPLQFSQPYHLERGDICTVTRLSLSVHTGTHLDAPAHFVPGGAGVEVLALSTLIGPALVVEALAVPALTAAVLAALPIPSGTERLLVKTDNAARWTVGETVFYEEYVAVTADGARWLVDNGIKLIGVDYLSVAPFAELVSPHQILLNAGVIPVEGLNLDGVPPGPYQLVCLPLLIPGSDGAPCRAVLLTAD
ncbi:MAG: cyclase family protein [Chloroflexi bacterium]|nr:cyclase family protein [Ardenticatenaceae bacterium]MBL1128494.1 cyclase family protein [Chloroflexota bacterium]NOG34572.1 cyclase family protein [Chloroflexota bacterium]GIK56794.1 MAG: cyclase [Chloroflexota bacterium]